MVVLELFFVTVGGTVLHVGLLCIFLGGVLS